MRKALSGAAAVLFVWGVVVAVTGGIEVRFFGVDVRSRDPFRALAGGFLLVLLQAFFFRRDMARDADRVVAAARRWAGAAALGLAAAVAAHGLVFGTYSVGGSDAYGYVNQAYDWSEGALPRPIAAAERLPFEASDRMQAPLGYRQGRQPQTIVPTYAPGLPLVMAVALGVLGRCGPFLVTPVAAAVFVWFTFALGRRAGGPLAGLAAAILLTVSPVVLYQTVWPMSDVPAGALWTGAALFSLGPRSRDAAWAGALAALGLLIRPNLAPVVLVLALALTQDGPARARLLRLLWFGAPISAAVLFTGWINALWYGSPFNSGYGAAAEIYSWSNVWPNLKLNLGWLWQAQTPLVAFALLPIVPRLRRGFDARTIAICVALFVATLSCYLIYAQFEAWWYLRFLLPAFGALMVLVAAALLSAARAIPKPFNLLGAVLVLCFLAASGLSFAAREGVFGPIHDNERRYATIASFAETLPGNAALVAVQHGPSLRFHTGRLTVRFDMLEHPQTQQLAPGLERAGYHPFLVVDDAETADVRRRFGVPADAPLPWPIRARMRERGGVTVYDMAAAPAADAPVAIEPSPSSWCDVVSRAAPRR